MIVGGGVMAVIGIYFGVGLLQDPMSAVIYLRKSEADIVRPFRVPGVPIIPFVGIAFCLLLMSALPGDTWLRLFVWLAIGLAIYFGYGKRHSVHGRKSR